MWIIFFYSFVCSFFAFYGRIGSIGILFVLWVFRVVDVIADDEHFFLFQFSLHPVVADIAEPFCAESGSARLGRAQYIQTRHVQLHEHKVGLLRRAECSV